MKAECYQNLNVQYASFEVLVFYWKMPDEHWLFSGLPVYIEYGGFTESQTTKQILL